MPPLLRAALEPSSGSRSFLTLGPADLGGLLAATLLAAWVVLGSLGQALLALAIRAVDPSRGPPSLPAMVTILLVSWAAILLNPIGWVLVPVGFAQPASLTLSLPFVSAQLRLGKAGLVVSRITSRAREVLPTDMTLVDAGRGCFTLRLSDGGAFRLPADAGDLVRELRARGVAMVLRQGGSGGLSEREGGKEPQA